MFSTIKSLIKSVVSAKVSAPAQLDLTAQALAKANQEIAKILVDTAKLYESGDELTTYKKISIDNEETIEQTMVDLHMARKKQSLAQSTYEVKSSELVEQKVSEAKKAQQLLKMIG